MKFLVNAQFPRRLSQLLEEAGHASIHTMDLPEQNRTSDAEINIVSIREQRILITKDEDFVISFLAERKPYKLLLVSTGNITNQELETLFATHLTKIIQALEENSYVELSRTNLTIHQ